MSKVSSGLRRGIKGSEESSKGSKAYRRIRRDIEGFEETLKGSKRHRQVRRDIDEVRRKSGASREVSRASKGCPMTVV